MWAPGETSVAGGSAGDLGAVGAVGPGWGRAGRPRGSGEALHCAQSGWGASGPKDLKLSNVIVSLLEKKNQDESHVK